MSQGTLRPPTREPEGTDPTTERVKRESGRPRWSVSLPLGFPVFPAVRPCARLGPPACACCSWAAFAPVPPGSGFPGWSGFSVAWFLALGGTCRKGCLPGADPKTEPSSRQVTLSTVGNCQRIPGFNGLETARAPTQELARSQVSPWQYFLLIELPSCWYCIVLLMMGLEWNNLLCDQEANVSVFKWWKLDHICILTFPTFHSTSD